MSFVQAVTNTSGAGPLTTWTISFPSVTAGNQMLLILEFGYVDPIGFTVTDSLGTHWSTGSAIFPFSGNGIAGFSSETIAAGGPDTITITVSGGGSLSAISAAALEYSHPFQAAPNTFPPGFFVWGLENPNGASGVPAGSGLVSPFTCANEIWQPLTTYDPAGLTRFTQVADTGPAPAHIQVATVLGVSAATPPVWNQSGGITNEVTGLQWINAASRIAPDLLIPVLCVGSNPFVEFPAPGAGWILRAQISGLSALSVYDQPAVSYESIFTVAVTKTVDTYDLDVMLFNVATRPAPAAGGGIEATFNSFVGPGHIGGGTI